jgi:hypothetical protein
MQASVDAMPQQRRMADLEERRAQQQLSQGDEQARAQQLENARGIIGRYASVIYNSPNALDTYNRVYRDPTFQQALKVYGYPVEQAAPGPNDTADSMKQQAGEWLGMYGGGIPVDEGISLSPGSVYVNKRTGQPIATAPPKEPDPTDDMREYEVAKQQGFTGTFVDYMTAMKKAGASTIDMRSPPTAPQGWTYVRDEDPNNPLGYKLVKTPGGPDQRTDAQQKAYLQIQRMKELSGDILNVAPAVSSQVLSNFAQRGGVAGSMANAVLSPELQKHFNAARGWIAGILRQDTGATIQPFEIEEYYPTFFPVPGDTPALVEQKRKLRKVTEDAIFRNSGVADSGPSVPGKDWTVVEVKVP